MRSINNVVDATNYVMFELNQPLHAYDVARLRGPAVLARRAHAGESLQTLDGVERRLDPSMTVIADSDAAIGVAGVMGGARSEVSADTRDIFLECAWFSPRRIRATRRALNLSSEASYRFERGVDLWNGPEALRRGVELIQATAGGTVQGEAVDLFPQVTHPPRIFLHPARVAQVLGVELPWHTLEKYLVAIGATVVAKPADGRLAVDVPGWRPDLVAEIDLIEEVARLHGYDNFPIDLRPYRVGRLGDGPLDRAITEVRNGLVGLGLLEASLLPMGPAEGADQRIRTGLAAQGLFEVHTLPLVPAEGAESVRLLNPLSAEEGYLRMNLLPTLIRRVEGNWAVHTRDVRLFEVGTVFRRGPAGAPPIEDRRVAGVITGGREPAHWTTAGKSDDVDCWDLRATFEAAVALAQPAALVQVEGGSWVALTPEGQRVGWAGPQPADAPPWAAPLFGFEVSIDPSARPPVTFTSLPTTPAADRDVALSVPNAITAAVIESTIRASGGPLLESVGVLDEYRGAGLPAGHRSLAFRLRFRATDRTLRDKEVDTAVQRIITALQEQHGIQLRAS